MTVKWISFDCYGTLIDWEAGIREYVRSALMKKGLAGDPQAVLDAWEPIQFQMIQRPYQTYREILFQSLYETFLRLRIPWKPSDSIGLGDAMGTWGPFPDVPEALARLGRKVRLALITNTDESIIAQTLPRLGARIDLVVTAESVGEYKPSLRPFQEALRRMGAAPDDVLHAAFGVAYDLAPAGEVGMRRCFVNRSGRSLDEPVDVHVRDLSELADRLDAGPAIR